MRRCREVGPTHVEPGGEYALLTAINIVFKSCCLIACLPTYLHNLASSVHCLLTFYLKRITVVKYILVHFKYSNISILQSP